MTEHSPAARTHQPTVFGPACHIKGDIAIEGDAVIHGTIEGNVEAAGSLEIGAEGAVRGGVVAGGLGVHGRVEGEVRCDGALELAGRIDGDVTAGKMEMAATATLVGNLRAKVIAVSEGAVYRGEVVIGPDAMDEPMPQKTRAATAAPAAPPRVENGEAAPQPTEAAAAGETEDEAAPPRVETGRAASGLLRRRHELLSRSGNGAGG